MKSFFIAAGAFVLTFGLDSVSTWIGTEGHTLVEREGNPVVRWLWGVLGNLNWVLPFLWVMLVLGAGYILWKKKKFLGLWLLYSFAAGHFVGFLSWQVSFPYEFRDEKTTLALLVLIAAVIGFILAKVHRSVREWMYKQA